MLNSFLAIFAMVWMSSFLSRMDRWLMLRPYVIIDVSVVFVMCSASALGNSVCVMPRLIMMLKAFCVWMTLCFVASVVEYCALGRMSLEWLYL